jgi:hypothetical protein
VIVRGLLEEDAGYALDTMARHVCNHQLALHRQIRATDGLASRGSARLLAAGPSHTA